MAAGDAGALCALIIRHGVAAHEAACLERKVGDIYRGYRLGVRRWL